MTSSDSGPLVIDTITSGGGLGALQAMAVSNGLLFTLVLLAGCYAIIRGLMSEPRPK